MGRPTLWGAGEMLRAYFSQAAEPPPSFFLALIRDIEPNPYISGEELSEPLDDGNGYARVEIPNTLDSFGDLNTGQLHMIYNVADVVFTSALADWGNIGYWALCDSLVDGNVVFFGDFDEPAYISAGDVVTVPANLLAIEFGPFFFDEEP